MAIAVEVSFRGASLEQYDEVVRNMGYARGGAGAPGGLFHWVTETDDGIRVVDVWESRALFERFAHDQIRPRTREVGIEDEPEIRYHEVHNYFTAG